MCAGRLVCLLLLPLCLVPPGTSPEYLLLTSPLNNSDVAGEAVGILDRVGSISVELACEASDGEWLPALNCRSERPEVGAIFSVATDSLKKVCELFGTDRSSCASLGGAGHPQCCWQGVVHLGEAPLPL